MTKRLVITMISWLVAVFPMWSQRATFASNLLTKMAKSLNYQAVDSLGEGTYPITKVWGKEVVAEYNAQHQVTHLGLRLFHPQMKKDLDPIVYNFLERYFLELYCWKEPLSLEQKMHDDKVMFTKGTYLDIKKVTENAAFSINQVENKFYEVSWAKTQGAAPFLSLAFPLQYELLLGHPLIEIEKTLYDQIIHAPQCSKPETDVQKHLLKDGVYSTERSKYYYIPELNTTRYYYRDKKGRYTLICDTIQPSYTAQNAFQTLTSLNNPLRIEQNLYGFKKSEYVVTLKQWINYCKANHLTVYTAEEAQLDGGTLLLLVAENKDLGYNHILSITVPKQFVTQPSLELKVKLNAFVTTHNIKNLYQQYKKTPKKKF